MYCKNCGSVINEASGFCPSCGQTVAAKASAPAAGGYSRPRQGYGAYPGGAPQPGYAYYGSPQYKTPGSSVNGLMMIVMAVLLIISAVGLMNFAVYKNGTEWIYSAGATNGDFYASMLHSTDGDIFEVFEYILEDDDELLSGICMIVSLIMMFVSILFAIVGLICALIKSYSGSAVTIGIGLLTAAFGYLANSIEGLNLVSEADSDYVHMSFASPAMFIVCTGLAIIAFVAAGRMKNND